MLTVTLASCFGGDETSDPSLVSDVSTVSATSDTSEDSDDEPSHSGGNESDPENKIDFSGTFSTDYPCACNLHADYTVMSVNDNEINITVTARLECRQISISARNNIGKVTIGDETYSFSTPSIENYETQLMNFELITQSRTISRGEGDLHLKLEVSWPFRGHYAGLNGELVAIGDMIAGGTVNIYEDGTVVASGK